MDERCVRLVFAAERTMDAVEDQRGAVTVEELGQRSAHELFNILHSAETRGGRVRVLDGEIDDDKDAVRRRFHKRPKPRFDWRRGGPHRTAV